MGGDCDSQWLKCQFDDGSNHRNYDYFLRSTKRDRLKQGKCVRKSDVDLKIYKRLTKSEESELNAVPACEDMEKKKTCKCVNTECNSNQKFDQDLPRQLKWCFLDQVQSANEPKKSCYDDVKWSETNGRFWSYKAYQAENPLCKHFLH